MNCPSEALTTTEKPNGVARVEPSHPDVYRAICQVAKEISRDGIAKGKKNEQQGYKFRGIDDIYNALSAVIAGAELCILPRMADRSQEERTTQKGGVLFYVTVRAEFDFVSARDGSKHTVTMYGEAMDSADKATNKAMSAAYKYACLQVFCIPTESMDDADAHTPDPAPKNVTWAKQRDAMAANKISQMERGVPYSEATPEAPVEQQLRDSIVQAEKDRKGKKPSKFDMLKSFGDLKKRYQKISFLDGYYDILAKYKCEHSNDFPETDEGMAQARACYKEMTLDVAGMETKAAEVVA